MLFEHIEKRKKEEYFLKPCFKNLSHIKKDEE
jgi:hypothetical protein